MPGPRKPSKPGGRPGRTPQRDRHTDRHGGRPAGAGRFERSGRSPKPRAPVVRDPARDRAASALADQAARFPDLDIQGLDARGLTGRDAAFAHAIYDAAIRRWLTIQALVERSSRTPWNELHPKVRGVLLCGGAQLLFLDRVPARAAIYEAVDWAKARVSPRSGSLVNAVLRRITELIARDEETGRPIKRETWTDQPDELPLHDGTALELVDAALPEDPLQRLAAATSHPIDLLRHWVKSRGLVEVRELATHALASPPVVLNVAHAETELPAECAPHAVPGHAVWAGPHAALEAVLRARTDLWVQDPGSSLGVSSITDLTPTTIIDVCAGLGTKTRQLAASFPSARLIATDIDEPRAATLARVFDGHDRVTVIPYADLLQHARTADLVLLDVPCSNTGVLARRVEARYRWSEKRTRSLTTTQRQLIADAIPLLRDGGRGALVYSTCSLSAEENEDMVRWAARWHNFSVERERRRAPGGGPGHPAERYSDGAYAALLR
ncbi:MAG: transcription antitermination factor NusB [Planctomycetota bacterium]